DRLEVMPLRFDHRVERRVDPLVVREPLDLDLRLLIPKPCEHAASDQPPNLLAARRVGRGHLRQDFPIATVQGKRDVDYFAIPARNLEHIAAPALIGNHALDLALVPPTMPAPPTDRQSQAVDPHHALNPLAVVSRAKGPVHDPAGSPIPIAPTLAQHLTQLRHHPLVVPASIAVRAATALAIGRSTADLQRPADHRDGSSRRLLDTP